jgi:hypothetical protein
VIPPRFYSEGNKRLLNWLDFALADRPIPASRYIYVLEKR